MTSDNADFSVGLHVDGNLDTKSIGDRTPEYIGSRYTESELETWPNVSWRLYLPGTDAFAEVNGSLLGRFWSAASDDTILHRRIHTWEGQTSVGGKLGYGRIRDAWSLARAVRITEILRQEGVLAREPSDDELRRLAGFISRAWKLFGAHELGSGYYYDSLNIYLIKSGALNATMPAYVLFRLSDDWPLGTHTRMFGWRVYAGMDGYLSGESYWNSENDSASAWNDLDGWGGSEVACEYARLFGLRTTLLAGMAYTPPWPVTTAGYYSHAVSVRARGEYMVADRLSVAVSAHLQPEYSTPYVSWLTRQFAIHGGVDAGVSYYLADRLLVDAGTGWSASGGTAYSDGRWVPGQSTTSVAVWCTIRWGPGSPDLDLGF
jgi:hypothetical protein